MDEPKKQEIVLKDVKKPGNWFYEEDGESVLKYVFTNVFAPAIKKLVADLTTNAVNAWLYGTDGGVKKQNATSRISWGGTGSNIVDYNNPSQIAQTRQPDKVLLSVFVYENVSFKTRGVAENVLSEMTDILDQYGLVTVADFLDICTAEYQKNVHVFNARSPEPTDRNYGWNDLSTAKVVPTWNGDFVIKFPKVKVKG